MIVKRRHIRSDPDLDEEKEYDWEMKINLDHQTTRNLMLLPRQISKSPVTTNLPNTTTGGSTGGTAHTLQLGIKDCLKFLSDKSITCLKRSKSISPTDAIFQTYANKALEKIAKLSHVLGRAFLTRPKADSLYNCLSPSYFCHAFSTIYYAICIGTKLQYSPLLSLTC